MEIEIAIIQVFEHTLKFNSYRKLPQQIANLESRGKIAFDLKGEHNLFYLTVEILLCHGHA